MALMLHRSIRASGLISRPKNQSPHIDAFRKDSSPFPLSQPPPAPPPPGSRISPAALFIIVILAAILFISGLLHLLVRFLIKKQVFSAPFSQSDGRHDDAAASIAGSDALQHQLRQLFHLHDSGLDQAFIDALPVFLCKEIVGSKEPFDCAVCLCEFAQEDRLRLLPACGHAFHVNCIDTWLLSNSTCPLCRGALFAPGGLATDYPAFDMDDPREDEVFSREQEAEGAPMATERRVFSVRLGKFKRSCTRNANDAMNTGESSSNSLDARRCFSMGSYQYVVADANLQVALSSLHIKNGKNPESMEASERKKLSIRSRGESFSVSKIWQWPNKKDKLPIPLDDASPDHENLSWIIRNARNS